MPISTHNPKGNGFVDYVLWGDNGLPLALIEAKRTSKDVEAGRNQAFLYANCLEEMHGQRPVIFYTNGYETNIWDDTFYATPRSIHGFYNKAELEWKIQQRQDRKDIRNANVNIAIAGRPYQMEAVQRVAESFVTDARSGAGIRGDKRAALLVMATGSGKTRVSASLVEVLLKNGWAKRILFLADQNALVTQAKESYGDHLPEISSVDLTKEKENNKTRLVFSTYPSMIPRIDKLENNQRFYGVGHFDLIILDEAHRSIYNKYKAIFHYFDAMVIGLTATPKSGIHINTFELLGCPSGDPTFSYELKEAVKADFLNPHRHIPASTKFIREGIKYKELFPKEKEKYEASFADEDTGMYPEEIESSVLNRFIFNKDTIFQILETQDIHLLKEHLSKLPMPAPIDERIRRFDLMMLKMQIASLLDNGKANAYADNLLGIANQLSKKYTIAPVLAQKPLIEAMRNPEFYPEASHILLENVREEIRELMVYLKGIEIIPIYSNIKDSAIVEDINRNSASGSKAFSMEAYKIRVERFIRENKNHIAIAKLRNNQAITSDELIAFEQIVI
ncbi:MAG: type I site-specific restriction endonuclease [Saprospiraceae bacterium]|jgi:type I site-specific restriction endonuclease